MLFETYDKVRRSRAGTENIEYKEKTKGGDRTDIQYND
jgi:hypothetical protein